MRKAWTVVAVGALLLVGGPISAQESRADDVVAAPAISEYRLGPGDRLRISVYDEDGLAGEYQVSERGTISFPLVGDYPAGGKTVPELRTDMEHRLTGRLLNDPKVTAEVITYRPFYILGEVNRPGTYAYTPGLTLYSAVATAQGFTYRANSRRVLITHAGETAENRVTVTSATPVLPGDTIRVREKIF